MTGAFFFLLTWVSLSSYGLWRRLRRNRQHNWEQWVREIYTDIRETRNCNHDKEQEDVSEMEGIRGWSSDEHTRVVFRLLNSIHSSCIPCQSIEIGSKWPSDSIPSLSLCLIL
jgi:hypothetical protein